MNILLWIVQTLSTALFIPAGGTKVFMFDKISGQVASNKALSHEAYTGIGIFFETLCALGLVIPAATRWWPKLTPIAATCLAVEAVLFAGFHALDAEYSPMVVSLVLAVLTAFVAYGRFVLKPI